MVNDLGSEDPRGSSVGDIGSQGYQCKGPTLYGPQGGGGGAGQCVCAISKYN